MRPERISFESYPGSFRIACLCCNNMECSCTTATFQLVEARARDQASQPPLRISIKVDVPTWQEIDAPPRSPQAREVVAEFLRDYPPSERELLKQWFRDRRRIVELLDQCLADPDDVETGLLFSIDELLRKFGELVPAFPLGNYEIDWEGQPYSAQERYCLNPDCDCRTVRVSFFKLGSKKDSQGRQIFDECFQAVVSLDGSARLDEVFSGDRAVAERVLAKWRKENGRDLDCVDWRYHKMKEIGRRSLEAAGEWEPGAAAPLPPAPPPLRRSPDRVGRNEPCPCGSGKKYKKCCGRGGEAES